jgi:predicted RNA-binding protein with RPS1 domain
VPARASDELYVRLPPEEVREHVHLWLLAPERELPEIVITTRHGRTLVEPGALARRLGGRAQVVLVETGEATYALRDVLGDDLAVWGGAARVYHPGFTLGDRASLHPRVYAFEGRESEAERAILTALGVECAQTEVRFAVGDDVEGEVVSLDPRTATLVLPDGCGRVRAGDLARGFVHSCHDVLRVGQRVRARVRELAADGTPWLDLQPFQADEVATIAEQACPGDVVRVRVRRRSNNGYQVELLPGADAFVPLAHCPQELEAERDDVLAARIVRLDVGERRIVVSLADAPATAEGARPLRLYPDGPVFLASDGVAAQRAASELDRSEGELTDVRERLDQAIAEADAARAERDRLADELRDERLRARALASDLRHTHGAAVDLDAILRSEALCDEGAFLAWLGVTHARLHGPAERARHPLRPVVVGPGFLCSLRDLQGVSLHRVFDTCVHVATGRAAEIPGLELHPLRAGAGGTEQRQRADGARAWRCALQVHSPSARRLHFWRLDGDVVELDCVGTHDADI